MYHLHKKELDIIINSGEEILPIEFRLAQLLITHIRSRFHRVVGPSKPKQISLQELVPLQ